jgi:hypothetical protein
MDLPGVKIKKYKNTHIIEKNASVSIEQRNGTGRITPRMNNVPANQA